MRMEGMKQSKFKHYISTPFRILKKAKDLYIKGLVDCAGRISCDAAAASAVQISHIPPDPKTKSIIKLNAGETLLQINQTRLITHGGERVVPSRNVGNEMGSFRQRQRIVGYKYNYNTRKMSYHTQVRKMGRIDEDKLCYFEEEDVNHHSKPNLLYLYPRSRING